MALPIEKLKKELLSLDPSDRAFLAHELITSLNDPSQYRLDTKTEKEIQRRIHNVRENRAKGVLAKTVLQKIEDKFH